MRVVKIYKKKLAICSVLASVSLLLTACDFAKSEEEKKADKAMEKVEIKLELAELSKPLTKEDNSKIYQQWGDEWLDVINTMLPLATDSVYKQPDCDMVEAIELSDNSVIQETPIVDVYCENGEVFSVSLNDVTQNRRILPNSKRLGRHTDEFINACLQPIKPDLMYPDSIVADSINANVELDKTQQRLIIQMPVIVKTGYDTKITHMVTCQVDNQLNATAKLTPMPKSIPNNNSQTEK
ncbi:MAG: hypothetical protein KGV51_00025 [Moraxellaceae bacterium]|nr:hypothetical protein [Moraxellaceae bacterium]